MEIQAIKQRFSIIGNTPALNRALEKAKRVATTDISVLVTGESGVGKENIPRIIHALSMRKHHPYIAVNCGAIPEGTIDSELFGHEKGSFTGATQARKGYFEEAHSGTIFLDEVAELPLATQVRLLRVLETGEFMRVGSSKVLKTDVRIVAATNVNMEKAITDGKFREDLYYRLNTVEIQLPPLRNRSEDILLLFRKFASDFAEKYRMPVIRLTPEAEQLAMAHSWPGNIRQLRNVVEQISVIETDRDIRPEKLLEYLPEHSSTRLPALVKKDSSSSGSSDFSSERDILYKILFDMRDDLNDLKKLTMKLLEDAVPSEQFIEENQGLIENIYRDGNVKNEQRLALPSRSNEPESSPKTLEIDDIYEEEIISLQDKEVELIRRALERNQGKRKDAAEELGISERTLYRKIKQFGL